MSPDFWAGYISGAVGICVGNPLDIIKVQSQLGTPTSNVSYHSLNLRKPTVLLKGMSLLLRLLIAGLTCPLWSRGSNAHSRIWCSQLSSLYDIQPIIENTRPFHHKSYGSASRQSVQLMVCRCYWRPFYLGCFGPLRTHQVSHAAS